MADKKSLEEQKLVLVDRIIKYRMQRLEAYEQNQFNEVVKINKKINTLRDKIDNINGKIYKKKYVQF